MRFVIFYSYHEGNTWNVRIAGAVRETLAGTGATLEIIRMDANRNPSGEFGRFAGWGQDEVEL